MALDRIKIQGGVPLRGTIDISGAKNAALPALAMMLLTPEKCTLRNVPDLFDIQTMIEILQYLGANLVKSEDRAVQVEIPKLERMEAPYDFVRKMRASVLLLGPLLARNKFARVSLPGGCAIGVRPIDLHLKAFAALGATIRLSEGYVEAEATELKGADFSFETVTVTGTVNAMMAASAAKGETILRNCSLEPEVVFCTELLAKMGVVVDGIGTNTLRIKGQSHIGPFDATLIPDRIETGTYLVAGAITQGDLILRNTRPEHLVSVISVLKEIGVGIETQEDQIRVKGNFPYQGVKFSTAPHPAFPTDMQAQMMTLLCLAKGASEITETIFENRYMHVPELLRMGASIKIKGSVAKIKGVDHLHGAPVMATDLRASASLVLAGLAAQGTTEVLRIYHLDRGYERMEKKLATVGAKIERIQETKLKGS